MATDREAVEAAFQTIGAVPPEEARVVHIRNTLELGEMEISRTLMREAEDRPEIQVVREMGPLCFEGSGAIRRV